MAKAEESCSNQITREPQIVGLTSKVRKPLYVRRNRLYAAHIISGKYKKKTKPNKPTISTSEIPNTYKGCAISFVSPALKQERTNQPRPRDKCVKKSIKPSSDLKCDTFAKVAAFLVKYYYYLFL